MFHPGRTGAFRACRARAPSPRCASALLQRCGLFLPPTSNFLPPLPLGRRAASLTSCATCLFAFPGFAVLPHSPMLFKHGCMPKKDFYLQDSSLSTTTYHLLYHCRHWNMACRDRLPSPHTCLGKTGWFYCCILCCVCAAPSSPSSSTLFSHTHFPLPLPPPSLPQPFCAGCVAAWPASLPLPTSPSPSSLRGLVFALVSCFQLLHIMPVLA